MKEQSLEVFEEFLERIIGVSKLEITGGKVATVFREEAEREGSTLNQFMETFIPIWDSWKREKGIHLISLFFEDNANIFKEWLCFVFPFSYHRVDVFCRKGGSAVDCNGYIVYTYIPEERELIQKICEKFGVDQPEQEVIRMLITNALKSLDPILSKLLEMNYRLFIGKIDFIEKSSGNGKVMLKVDFVGRIG